MIDEHQFLSMLLASAQKYPRRVFHLGEENKKADLNDDIVYIRELNILAGWVGAATWDASIIMSQYIKNEHSFLENRRVLECGSGSGLLGMIVGRFCSEIVMTDFQNSILENIEYNIWLNTHELTEERMKDIFPCSEGSKFYEFAKHCRSNYIHNNAALYNSAKVAYLNWFKPEDTEKPADELEPDTNPKLPPNNVRFRIDGGKALGKFPVILGSELTYCLPGIPQLVKVIEEFLEEGGVFWEIISIFRGPGPKTFMLSMKEHGFIVEARYVGKEYYDMMAASKIGNKNKYTHSDKEQYLLWTCYRKTDLESGAMARKWGSNDNIPKFGEKHNSTSEPVNWESLDYIEDHVE